MKLASQVVYQLLLRMTKITKKKVWFKIDDKHARFGLEKFVVVTGLNASNCEDVDKILGAQCQIVNKYFKKSGKRLQREMYNAFES